MVSPVLTYRAIYMATLYIFATLQNGPFDHFIDKDYGNRELDARLAFSDGLDETNLEQWWWRGLWSEYLTAITRSVAGVSELILNDTSALNSACKVFDNDTVANSLIDTVPLAQGSPWTRSTCNIFKGSQELAFACILRNATPRFLSFLTRPALYAADPLTKRTQVVAAYDFNDDVTTTSVSAFMHNCIDVQENMRNKRCTRDINDIDRIVYKLADAMYARSMPAVSVKKAMYTLTTILHRNVDNVGCSQVDTVASTKFRFSRDNHVVRYDLHSSIRDIYNSTTVQYRHTTVLNPSAAYYTTVLGAVGAYTKARLIYRVTSRTNDRSVSIWHRLGTGETIAVIEGNGIKSAVPICKRDVQYDITSAWRAQNYIAYPVLPSVIAYVSLQRTTVLEINFTSLCKAFLVTNTNHTGMLVSALETAFSCSDGSTILTPWLEFGKDAVRKAMGARVYDDDDDDNIIDSLDDISNGVAKSKSIPYEEPADAKHNMVITEPPSSPTTAPATITTTTIIDDKELSELSSISNITAFRKSYVKLTKYIRILIEKLKHSNSEKDKIVLQSLNQRLVQAYALYAQYQQLSTAVTVATNSVPYANVSSTNVNVTEHAHINNTSTFTTTANDFKLSEE